MTSESDTERDGALSYPAEWHALAHGVYDGIRSWKGKPGRPPENPDVEKEPHYYKGGYVAGTVLQVVLMAAVAYIGFGM